jgi:hypothetical protein
MNIFIFIYYSTIILVSSPNRMIEYRIKITSLASAAHSIRRGRPARMLCEELDQCFSGDADDVGLFTKYHGIGVVILT